MLSRLFRIAFVLAIILTGQASTVHADSSLSITITSPNGGEVWTVGEVHRITWESSPEIDKVTLGYKSCPSCLNWIVTNIPNTGYYDWTVYVGNTTNTQFTIEIIGYQTGVGSVIDYSDAPFTVNQVTPPPPPPSPLSLTITSPNGGEVWTVGEVHRITWQASPEIDTINIGYKSCPSCLSWIATNLPNTGYYDWTVYVGNTINTQFTLQIFGYQTGVGSTYDYSDAPFTVLQPPPPPTPTPSPTPPPLFMNITSPNGGELWRVGEVRRITWQSSPEIDRVYIGYRYCVNCVEWFANYIPNTGYYDWTVDVGNITSTEFTMEIYGVQSANNRFIFDRSDAPFTIRPPQLSTPVLLEPINGQVVATVRPTFDWDDVSGATAYILQVSTTSDFSNLVLDLNIPISYETSSKMPRNMVLYWRVRAVGNLDPSEWAVGVFTLK